MNATISAPPRLSHSQRRVEVRRLYYRHRLSMLEIARKLGVSKPTVWRDLRWLAQFSPEPKDPLKALNREIEDAKEEAWRAYARSLEPSEVETETMAGEQHVIKRVRKTGSGDVRFLKLIGDLTEMQVKLFHSNRSKALAKADDERCRSVAAIGPHLQQPETDLKRSVTLCNAFGMGLDRLVPANPEPRAEQGMSSSKVIPLSQVSPNATCMTSPATDLQRDETEMKRFETPCDRICNASSQQKPLNYQLKSRAGGLHPVCDAFQYMDTPHPKPELMAQAA